MAEIPEKIYNYLINSGMTPEGAAGMMGNIYAESGMIPNRVEILCLQRLKEIGKYYTDATYTAFVDDGTIDKETFLHPLPGKQYGYGLCQWTSPYRKSGLYNLAKSRKKSIGDLETQLEFLVGELKLDFRKVWDVLTTTSDVKTASDIVLTKFEIPADESDAVKQKRYEYSLSYYKGGEDVTEKQAIDKVLNILLAEEGYHETGENIQKYGKEMHQVQPSNMDYPAAWCDAFVDWGFYKAFGKDLAKKILCGDFDDYTVRSAQLYMDAGRWTQTPKRGYQIFFRNSGGICHTGMVWDVVGNRVYTIEGNTSDAVAKRVYDKNEWKIAGYGMPKYELAAKESVGKVGTCTVTLGQYLQGAKDPEVKTIQILLNGKGYKGKDGKKLTVNGVLDENTAYAITNLQKKAGMKDINFGSVAGATWKILLNGYILKGA